MSSKNETELIFPLFGDLTKPHETLLEEWTLSGDNYNRSTQKPLIAAKNDMDAAIRLHDC